MTKTDRVKLTVGDSGAYIKIDRSINQFNGREWCEENYIPEFAFAHAVNTNENLYYGVSPMYPWKYE